MKQDKTPRGGSSRTSSRPSHSGAAMAPYNFVPLPNQFLVHPDQQAVEKGLHGRYAPDRHHGWIELDIVAETPLYTRAAQIPGETDWKAAAQFFHYDDPNRPVIPGSSLRGMLRSLVEVVTWSKVTATEEGLISYRAIGDPVLGRPYQEALRGPTPPPAGPSRRGPRSELPSLHIQAGYLHRCAGKWCVHPARSHGGQSYTWAEDRHLAAALGWSPGSKASKENRQLCAPIGVKFLAEPSGQSVSIQVMRRDLAGAEPATVVVPGPMPNKHRYAVVFAEDQEAHRHLPVPNARLQLYESDGGPLKEGAVAFYRVDAEDGIVDIGWTVMMRLRARHQLGDAVPEDWRDTGRIDLAEGLFGQVFRGVRGTESHKVAAIRGRIQVEDAVHMGSGDPYLTGLDGIEPGQTAHTEAWAEGFRTPFILSSPKPTAYALYLEQPSAGGSATRLTTYESEEIRARGHKFYWHKPAITHTDIFETAIVCDDQHTQIRPVRPGTEFRGRINFANLSDVELGALWVVLDLPASARHRLGMGKPLGMGSVRITPHLHLMEPTRRYGRLFRDDHRLEVGEMPASEVDSTRAQALRAFQDLIGAHTMGRATSARAIRDVWESPRLAALRCLLEWDNAPDPERVAYVAVDHVSYGNAQGDTNSNYAWSGYEKQWKDHWVLPGPLEVLQRASHLAAHPAKQAVVPSPVAIQSPTAGLGTLRNGQTVTAEVVKFVRDGVLLRIQGGESAIYRQGWQTRALHEGETVTVKVTNIDAKPIQVRMVPDDRRRPNPS